MREIIWNPSGDTLSAPPPTNALILLCFRETLGASSFLNHFIKADASNMCWRRSEEAQNVIEGG